MQVIDASYLLPMYLRRLQEATGVAPPSLRGRPPRWLTILLAGFVLGSTAMFILQQGVLPLREPLRQPERARPPPVSAQPHPPDPQLPGLLPPHQPHVGPRYSHGSGGDGAKRLREAMTLLRRQVVQVSAKRQQQAQDRAQDQAQGTSQESLIQAADTGPLLVHEPSTAFTPSRQPPSSSSSCDPAPCDRYPYQPVALSPLRDVPVSVQDSWVAGCGAQCSGGGHPCSAGSARTEAKRVGQTALLSEFVRLAAELDVLLVLAYGSLIAARHRNGTALPWDHDFDFRMWAHDTGKFEGHAAAYNLKNQGRWRLVVQPSWRSRYNGTCTQIRRRREEPCLLPDKAKLSESLPTSCEHDRTVLCKCKEYRRLRLVLHRTVRNKLRGVYCKLTRSTTVTCTTLAVAKVVLSVVHVVLT